MVPPEGPARHPHEDPPDILRRVFSGTGLQILGRVYGAVCSVAALILLADHLKGGAAFGRITYYLAVFALLDAWTDFGTGIRTVQRTADGTEPLHGVLREARRTRLLHASIGLLVLALIATLNAEAGAALLILAGLYLFTHSLELSGVVFRNRIAWRVPVTARTIGNSLRLLFVLLLIYFDVREPMAFVLAVAASTAVANSYLHSQARRLLAELRAQQAHELPNARIAGPRSNWRALLPFGLTAGCQQAYFYADNLLLRPAVGDAELGHYNAAVRIMGLAILGAVFASQASLPWFTRAAARGELDLALARIGPRLFAFACLAIGLVFPWTEQTVSVFGQEFATAGPSLRWLLGGAIAVYGGAFFLTALIALKAQHAVLAIVVAGLVVNISGNLILIPRHGIEGAAMATFATESLVALAASGALALRGVRLVHQERGWWWLGGPLLFCVAAFGSAWVGWS